MKRILITALGLMLVFCLAACAQEQGSDEEESTQAVGNAAAAIETVSLTPDLKARYFDMARDYRFDYVYPFEADAGPDIGALLMYTFVMSGSPDEMSAASVEDIAAKYFGVEKVTHASTKEWTYADGVYQATAGSYNSEPFAELTALTSQKTDDGTIYTASLIFYTFTYAAMSPDQNNMEGNMEGYGEEQAVVNKMAETESSFVETTREMIATGETESFTPNYRRTIVYLANPDDTFARFLSSEDQYN